MPATATGRGAQVVLDPISDHAKAARGAYAATLEANLQKRRDDVVAGTAADGYSPDGRPTGGTVAVDQLVAPSLTATIGPAVLNHPPVNAETFTIPDGISSVFFSNTVSTLTVVMPANPAPNQRITMTWFGNITTLTVQGNVGQQVGGAPTTASSITPFTWQIIGTRWQRV